MTPVEAHDAPTATDVALRRAADAPLDTVLPVVLHTDPLELDELIPIDDLRTADSSVERERFFEARAALAQETHHELDAALRRDERVVSIEHDWMTGNVLIRARADSFPDLARLPGVIGLSGDAPLRNYSYDGVNLRDNVVTRAGEAIADGHRGELALFVGIREA